VRPGPAAGRRARALLHDVVRLESPTALSELRALADTARDLAVFDKLIPEIAALGELELLVLVGLFIVDESVHQGFHAAHIFKFGSGTSGL
jgi:hypothetical protein